MTPAAAFDRLAPTYDELWTNSAVGRLQRDAVWREIGGLFQPGERVLDLGCGTGEDTLWLARSGVHVHAMDIAPRMVEITAQRAASEGLADRVTAEVLPVEALSRLAGQFDGAIADFGVLNCVSDIGAVTRNLARLIRPGGRAVLCPMGRFCFWETAWYLLRGEPAKAFRRWRRGSVETSLGFPVYYRSVAEIDAAFRPHFRRVGRRGIGVFVPPSYVAARLGPLRALRSLDRVLAGWPLLRAMADHQLLVFLRGA